MPARASILRRVGAEPRFSLNGKNIVLMQPQQFGPGIFRKGDDRSKADLLAAAIANLRRDERRTALAGPGDRVAVKGAGEVVPQEPLLLPGASSSRRQRSSASSQQQLPLSLSCASTRPHSTAKVNCLAEREGGIFIKRVAHVLAQPAHLLPQVWPRSESSRSKLLDVH